ncbi:GTP cyclohydrolase IIa [Halococcoides cellulosivorans]|uniref:GTP cyclohydrolase III n=1 Tax=Halococcoides cellulosivorans TaxID=1679096 RepID=A0A2R4X101_9EURY|nr:GTP cyclohydrolase III [Halococcoides cellulosivorans]AWB27456.1 GTP cyclohydrolase IIa [Halococcoides cellulosivorans]
MPNTQVTLVQIDNYGPWTVTPEPRREVDLQTLQSRLYADLSQQFGSRGGYVFFTRFDNMIAVTNGIDESVHRQVQTSIRNRYPVTTSFGIGVDPSPAVALEAATEAIQDAGSAQDAERREVLSGSILDESADDDLTIAHFDVNDATERLTDRLDAFATFAHIERGYAELMAHFYEAHEGLAFFVGGDNVIAVCPDLDRAAFEETIAHVDEAAGVDLKVGVGGGATAESAGMAAKHALERCRENGHDVDIDDSAQ